jgi:chromosome partitioning protein
MATIEKVRKKLTPKLMLLGVLVTMYDARTGHSRGVLEEVRRAFGDRTFKSVIAYSVRANDSSAAGRSILASRGATSTDTPSEPRSAKEG